MDVSGCIMCAIQWSLNALLFIWLLRFLITLCIPERRKPSTTSGKSTRQSQDGGSVETTNLLTPIPLTPFYVESVV
ncbi:uncharacterized protein CELE_R02F11.11 [Caenorhabditis elegans]|uniref:Secreted protein n=1 Tax=Caenorhabditis elegans TaxID=6239 RepID=U4PQY1_CAEEL|nr:Secreted protein [Caenorhabditis elegans]CDH92999.1 Secreted protein [Caenorhabditis elegans]|eukprot:NP_001294753.1 Uncharacterized protein CELE_R02F11.11 [Caenorhabditis elegans]